MLHTVEEITEHPEALHSSQHAASQFKSDDAKRMDEQHTCSSRTIAPQTFFLAFEHGLSGFVFMSHPDVGALDKVVLQLSNKQSEDRLFIEVPNGT